VLDRRKLCRNQRQVETGGLVPRLLWKFPPSRESSGTESGVLRRKHGHQEPPPVPVSPKQLSCLSRLPAVNPARLSAALQPFRRPVVQQLTCRHAPCNGHLGTAASGGPASQLDAHR